jgi:hypothetical protein
MSPSRRKLLWRVLLLVAIPVVLFWGFLEFAAAARERARRTACHSNLSALAYGVHLYSSDFNEAFPESFGGLYGYIRHGGVYLCPSAGKATRVEHDPEFSHENYTPAMFDDTNSDYVYVSGLMANDPQRYVLAFDDEWNHDGDGVNVLYTGGYGEWLGNVTELHAQLARQEKELAANGRKMKVLRPAWSSWPDPPARAGRQPWHDRRGGRALAAGVFAAVLVALALVIRAVRRRAPSAGPPHSRESA